MCNPSKEHTGTTLASALLVDFFASKLGVLVTDALHFRFMQSQSPHGFHNFHIFLHGDQDLWLLRGVGHVAGGLDEHHFGEEGLGNFSKAAVRVSVNEIDDHNDDRREAGG